MHVLPIGIFAIAIISIIIYSLWEWRRNVFASRAKSEESKHNPSFGETGRKPAIPGPSADSGYSSPSPSGSLSADSGFTEFFKSTPPLSSEEGACDDSLKNNRFPLPESSPTPEAGGVTRLIQSLSQAPSAPAAASPVSSEPAPNSGPGEFTRILAGPGLPPATEFSPLPAVPKPTPPTPPRSHLPGKAPNARSSRKLPASPFEGSIRLVMQVSISLIVLGGALYIILSPIYDPKDKHWAYGSAGTILGFWLKH